jgi:hypothetical protein
MDRNYFVLLSGGVRLQIIECCSSNNKIKKMKRGLMMKKGQKLTKNTGTVLTIMRDELYKTQTNYRVSEKVAASVIDMENLLSLIFYSVLSIKEVAKNG